MTTPAEALAIYRDAPAGYAATILGVDPRLHQVEIMNSVRDHRRTLVYSCNSIGKDFVAGALTHWALGVHEEALVITTAITGEQVNNVQWKEIRAQYNAAPYRLGGNMAAVMPTYRISDRRGAFGISTRDEPERLQGHHEAYILIIITEASGVQPAVWEGLRSTMAAGDVHILALTNPTRNYGEVYDAAHGIASGWNVLRYGAFDLPNMHACQELGPAHMTDEGIIDDDSACPNPYPYLITHRFERECARDFGEDSDYYAVHVDGQFGKAGETSLIPLSWVEEAFERPAQPYGDPCGGLDVARSGNDKTAYTEIQGSAVVTMLQWLKAEVTETYARMNTMLEVDPRRAICIDDTGLGGGIAPRLRLEYRRVRGVDFSASADDTKHYASKPAEMGWRLRQRLDPTGDEPLSLALIPQVLRRPLTAQLVGVEYDHNEAKGRLRIFKKGKDKSGKSPDMFDALCLAAEAARINVNRGFELVSEKDRVGLEDRRAGPVMAGIRKKVF